MRRISANQDEIKLYCLTGEALWRIQVVEQALSFSLTLRMNPTATKGDADKELKRMQAYTLGQAIKILKEKKFFNSCIETKLSLFLTERNWLVHKALTDVHHERDPERRVQLITQQFSRIKAITDNADDIHFAIEQDMINFCESQGSDMSKTPCRVEL